MGYILYGAVFFTVVLSVLAVYRVLNSSRLAVLERLESQARVVESPLKTGEGRGAREGFLSYLAVPGHLIPRRFSLEKVQKKLIQAHIFMRAEEFIGLSLLAGAGFFSFAVLLTDSFIPGILAFLIGYKLPDFYVNSRKAKRAAALNRQLPESLIIIANGLRAGYSFPQAMDVVGREMEPPIAEEFSRVIRDNRLGKTMEEALRELAERTANEDLDMIVTALLIQRQVGGNLAEILDKIENTIRERVRIKGEIKTLTSQQRMSAVIIVLLPFAVTGIIYLMNPEYMLTLFQEPLGLVMVGVAFVSQLLGVIMIRKIVNIDV